MKWFEKEDFPVKAAAWVKGEITIDQLAQYFGVPVGTASRRVNLAGYHRKGTGQVPPPPPPPPPPLSIEQSVLKDIKDVGEKREVTYWKNMYKEAVSIVSMQELVANTIRDVAPAIPKVMVEKPPEQSVLFDTMGKGSETDILQLSDIHGGEVVRSEETMGMNEFNMTIMNRRLGLLARKVIELVELRRTSLYIPKLEVAMEGDMLSGEIHDELIRTNVGHMMTISVRVAFLLAQMLAFMSPHFEAINVRCVVGNHPRLFKKVYWKEKYINWDYTTYQWMAVLCTELKNVTFEISQSPYILTKIENTNTLMYHGDGVKSWMGVPWYGIERSVARLREMFAVVNKSFDMVLLGHFHNRADLEKTSVPIIINGSIKGGDEFSMGSLQTTNRPSQNLIYVHSKNGYIGGQPIHLQDADKKREYEFKDFLTPVWRELQKEIKVVTGEL